MSDLGTFTVQSDALREAAKLWAGCAEDAAGVADDISPAVDQGDKFGVLAGSCGVTSSFNTWIAAMHKAATDAAKTFRYLDAALQSTANAYDGADNTSATSMQQLDGMI